MMIYSFHIVYLPKSILDCITIIKKGLSMAKINYNYEKRARELEKQKKKEEKRKKKEALKNESAEDTKTPSETSTDE